MKHFLFTALLLLFGLSLAVAQTTATNFTATDCNATSHTLFTELDAGKIVVLVWVMPCAACISDAKAAFDAVGSFASSNPGKVVFYLSDDIGDAGCSTLNSWASTNGMAGATTFSNAGIVIDENNYGGSGMPHVVVMGGTNHKIYLNLLNGSNHLTEIQNAISSALGAAAVGNVSNAASQISVYPDPSSGNINITCTLEHATPVNIDVVNMRGFKVQSISVNRGPGIQTINVLLDNLLNNGYYLLRVTANGASNVTGFNLAR